MKKHTFSLEAVLDLRATAKEKAEDALRLSIQQRDAAVARCAQAEATLAQIASEIGSGRFSAGARGQGWQAMCRQQQVCRDLENRRIEEDKLVVACRNDLIKADRDHELVVRLKDKWRTACTAEEAHAEELQLEEFVNSRRQSQPQPV